MDQFTEVKVIHSGTVQYRRPDVRNNPSGSAAVQKFQGQVKKTYLVNLHKKDREHFGTAEGTLGPLEAIFGQLDFKPLVFGTFAEIHGALAEFGTRRVRFQIRSRFQQFYHEYSHEM